MAPLLVVGLVGCTGPVASPVAPSPAAPDSCELARGLDTAACRTRTGFETIVAALNGAAEREREAGRGTPDEASATCIITQLLACEARADDGNRAAEGVFSPRPPELEPMGIYGLRGLGDTYMALGSALEMAGAPHDDIAARLIARANGHPERPELAIAASSWLVSVGRHREARDVIEPVASASLDQGDLWVRARSHEYLGRALTGLGALAQAEQVLATSLSAHEAWRRERVGAQGRSIGCPYQAMGELYSSRGDLRRGYQMHARVAALEPERRRTQVDAAIAAICVGELDAARKFTAQVRKLGDADSARKLADAVARGRLDATPRTTRDAALAELAAVVALELTDFSPEIASACARRAFELEPTERRRQLTASFRAKLAGQGGSSGTTLGAGGPEQARRALESARVVEAAQLARELPPGDEREVLLALSALFLRDYATTDAAILGLRKDRERSPGADVVEGHLKLARGDPARARALFQQALQAIGEAGSGPDTFAGFLRREAFLGLGWAATNEGRPQEALLWLGKTLADRPNDLLALLGKGNALAGLGRGPEARATFEHVLSISPGDPYARAELGFLDLNENKLDDAKRRFREALDIEGERYTCPYEGLGLLYLRSGRLSEAKANFERAIDINPNIEFRKFNGLAKIYIAEGDYERARDLLEKSVTNYPYDPEARSLLAALEKVESR